MPRARVLLLYRTDRVLLLYVQDPDEPDHYWWELPDGVDTRTAHRQQQDDKL